MKVAIGLWFVNGYTDWAEVSYIDAKKKKMKRSLEFRMKMHFFGAAAALFNLLASVDLKVSRRHGMGKDRGGRGR